MAKKLKVRNGRKAPEINPDEIRELASEGNTLEDISDLVGVSAEVIENTPEYKQAYEIGMVDMRCSLRHWQFQSAKSGNTTMLIWLGKIILGQKEETQTTIKLDREDDALTKSLLGLAQEMDKANGK